MSNHQAITVNQTLTLAQNQSTLTFAASDIKSMQLGQNGSLIVTLNNGHTLTIANFHELADNAAKLSLQDGSTIDAKELLATLTCEMPSVNPSVNIVEHAADQTVTYNLLSGDKYNLAFDPAHAGAHVVTFGDQGQVVMQNVDGAAQLNNNGKDTTLQQILHDLESSATSHNTAQTVNTDLAQTAQQLAGVEPAAGPTAFGASGGSADFGSTIEAAPFTGVPPQGPIAPTELNYGLPTYGLEVYPVVNDHSSNASVPVITVPLALTVYEANLNPTTAASETITVNYGADANGAAVTANNNFSTSVAHLTENGQAVTVTETGNTYTGTANGQTVFTMAIGSDGHATFTLDAPLDNHNGAPITLNFGATATDADGDTAITTVSVNVVDDAPVAHNDVNTAIAGALSSTGNVITGAGDTNTGGADQLSHDGGNHITAIAFGGTVVAVPTTGTTTIDGAHGELTISADGSYTYMLDHAANTTDAFTYTLADADGSSSSASLTLNNSIAAATSITVDNGAHCAFTTQGNSLILPVHVTTAGDGAQELTSLTVSGVGAEWTVNGGWTAVAGHAGEYQLALPAGTASYDGTVTLVSTGNTTSDESDLVFTANVSDNGQTASSTADINIGTLEAPVLNVPASLTWENYTWAPYTETLSVSSAVTVPNEVIHTITINLNDTFDGLNPNNWSLADMGATLNEGTQTAPGIWTIDVNATDTSAALNGLTIDFPGGNWSDPAWLAIHPGTNGVDWHNDTIQVTADATETLSCGCTSDVTVTKSIGVDFGLTPLVVDLTGHGFNLTDNAHGVLFDMNADGKLDQTSWIGAGTGLLCIDLNHNGIIDNTTELFGNGSTSGFTILAQYDTNHDGVINASDAAFNQLMIWTDTNHDGVSQAGELHDLASYGITSISLTTVSTNETIGDSFIGQTATVTYADGHTTQVGDAWFNVTDSSLIGVGVREDGTIGNDILTGTAQNDVLAGHGGNDVLIGGGGADTFLFDAISPSYIAQVQGFSEAGGSKLDLSALLTQYNPLQASIDNFVHATSANGNTTIAVDVSGSGKAADFVNVAVLQGVSSLNVDDLLAHHQLIAQHAAAAA